MPCGQASTHVPGVDDAGWLDQHRLDLSGCDRTVLDAARHHVELTWAKHDIAIAKLDSQITVEYEEELVGVIVAVPDELALQFDDLDLVVVQPRDDLWRPVVGDAGQLVAEINWLVGHWLPAYRRRPMVYMRTPSPTNTTATMNSVTSGL
jgi:hypothetical protein